MDENNKLTTTGPGEQSGGLVERRRIGGSSLHKRVAAAAPLEQAKAQALDATMPKTDNSARNPFDVSLEMPNRIGLMLDCSGSMNETVGGDWKKGKKKIQHLREACADFVNSCDFSNTAVAIETFPGSEDDEEEYKTYEQRQLEQDPLAHLLPGGATPKGRAPKRLRGLCNVPGILLTDIDALQASGGTPMAQCIDHIVRSNSLTRGVLVSDGEADYPTGAREKAQQWKDAEIPIDTVHIGDSTAGEQLLKDIAEMTGGMYIKFDNVANFTKAFKYLAPAYRAMLTAGSAALLGAKEVK